MCVSGHDPSSPRLPRSAQLGSVEDRSDSLCLDEMGSHLHQFASLSENIRNHLLGRLPRIEGLAALEMAFKIALNSPAKA
jgi:hypothetical protein